MRQLAGEFLFPGSSPSTMDQHRPMPHAIHSPCSCHSVQQNEWSVSKMRVSFQVTAFVKALALERPPIFEGDSVD